MYDTNGAPFLSTDNLAPRIGAVYDPFNDGQSKCRSRTATTTRPSPWTSRPATSAARTTARVRSAGDDPATAPTARQPPEPLHLDRRRRVDASASPAGHGADLQQRLPSAEHPGPVPQRDRRRRRARGHGGHDRAAGLPTAGWATSSRTATVRRFRTSSSPTRATCRSPRSTRPTTAAAAQATHGDAERSRRPGGGRATTRRTTSARCRRWPPSPSPSAPTTRSRCR